MKYYIIPQSLDGCDLPTQPEALPIEEIGTHLAQWLEPRQRQGYFSNCKMERIPIDKLEFRLVPEESDQKREEQARRVRGLEPRK